MIDRQDLSTAIGIERLPVLQEKIIRQCHKLGKPVIVASQFLVSMVNSPKPTIAEVSDVERAVSQKADYIMLSEETAIGKYPQAVVDVMNRVIDMCSRRTQAVILAAGAAAAGWPDRKLSSMPA